MQIVGSMELLGDPLALVNKVSDSVLQFFKRTQAEFRGEEPTFGAGARLLVSGVVGSAFGACVTQYPLAARKFARVYGHVRLA